MRHINIIPNAGPSLSFSGDAMEYSVAKDGSLVVVRFTAMNGVLIGDGGPHVAIIAPGQWKMLSANGEPA